MQAFPESGGVSAGVPCIHPDIKVLMHTIEDVILQIGTQHLNYFCDS